MQALRTYSCALTPEHPHNSHVGATPQTHLQTHPSPHPNLSHDRSPRTTHQALTSQSSQPETPLQKTLTLSSRVNQPRNAYALGAHTAAFTATRAGMDSIALGPTGETRTPSPYAPRCCGPRPKPPSSRAQTTLASARRVRVPALRPAPGSRRLEPVAAGPPRPGTGGENASGVRGSRANRPRGLQAGPARPGSRGASARPRARPGGQGAAGQVRERPGQGAAGQDRERAVPLPLEDWRLGPTRRKEAGREQGRKEGARDVARARAPGEGGRGRRRRGLRGYCG
jgi:hypothetical protein